MKKEFIISKKQPQCPEFDPQNCVPVSIQFMCIFCVFGYTVYHNRITLSNFWQLLQTLNRQWITLQLKLLSGIHEKLINADGVLDLPLLLTQQVVLTVMVLQFGH